MKRSPGGLLPKPLAALPFLLLGLMVLAFFARVLFGGQTLVPTDVLFSALPWKAYASQFGVNLPHNELLSDMLLENLAWKSFASEVVSHGAVPLWNPNIFGGEPFLAAGQAGVLYPLGLIFYVIPPVWAYGWFTALHFLLAGVLMFSFVRVLGANRTGAAVSAISYAFSGLMVVSVIWPMVLGTIIWLPLLLLIVELIIRAAERGATNAPGAAGHSEQVTIGIQVDVLPLSIAGGAVLGIVMLSGHLEYSFYVLFSILFFALARLVAAIKGGTQVSRLAPTVLGLGSIAIIGVALAGAQLLPFFELAKENFRTGLVSYQDVVGYALPKKQILSFLMPDVFGNPTHSAYFDLSSWQSLPVTGAKDMAGSPRSYPFWGIKNYVEAASYIGVLPLLMALVAPWLRRDRYTTIFAVFAAFSLLLAFGTPLYRLFWVLPGFDQLHTPFRWLFPFTVCATVLAGLGASSITDRGNRQVLGRAALGLGGAVGAVILVALGFAVWKLEASVALAQRLLVSSQALAAAFSSPQMLFSYEFRNLLALGLLLAGGGIVLLLRPHSAKGRILLVVLIAADLFYFGFNYNAASDPKLLDFTPPAVEFLKKDNGLFRVASFNSVDNLAPNTAMLTGLQDARGYDSIILRDYVDFWRLIEEPHGLLYNRIHKLMRPESLTSPLLDLLNVKYILTTLPLPDSVGQDHLREVYRGEVLIYENTDNLPRAFVVARAIPATTRQQALEVVGSRGFDVRSTVVIETDEDLTDAGPSGLTPVRVASYEANQVVVDVAGSQGGYLVLTDNYFAGWQALVDGKETQLYRADGTFRAVQLPAGARQVTFKYGPQSFNFGLLSSFLGLMALLVGAGYWGWQRIGYRLEAATPMQIVAKNVSVPTGIQLLNRLLDFGFAIFMLRYLGPTNAGKYAFAVALLSYFIVLTDFGLTTLTTREVARSKQEANRYLSNSAILRLFLTFGSLPVLGGILGLYAWSSDLTADTAWAAVLLVVGLFPSGLASALSSVFSAHERMEYAAAVALVSNLLKLALGAIALLLGFGIVGLAMVSIAVSAVTAGLLFYLFRRVLFRPFLEFDLRFQWRMMRTSYPLMMNIFLSAVFFRMDVVLLKPMQGDLVTGWYTTAYKFVDGLVIIPSLFTLAIFPILSRYADAGNGFLRRAYIMSLRGLLLVAMPLAVGISLLGDRIVTLFFGQDFAPAGIALSILIWFLPFSFINSLTQYVLIAANKQRFLTLAFIIGASFNIAANWGLIPIYSYVGASVTTVLSEIVLMITFLVAVWKHVGSVPFVEISWRPVLAALLMGAAIWLLRPLNMAALVLIGAAIYFIALVLLRTFNQDDRALIRGLLGRKVPANT